jgi:hypothetical protein
MSERRYFIRYPADAGHPEETREVSRAEAVDRLEDWVIDPELAIALLEAHPGEEHRLTPFSYWRADTVSTRAHAHTHEEESK